MTKVNNQYVSVKSQDKTKRHGHDKNVVIEYNVVRCSDKCEAELCLFVCPACKICSHLYQCICPDTKPLCKHIHKVHLMHTNPEISATFDPIEEPDPEFFVGDVEESLEIRERVVHISDLTVEKNRKKSRKS